MRDKCSLYCCSDKKHDEITGGKEEEREEREEAVNRNGNHQEFNHSAYFKTHENV